MLGWRRKRGLFDERDRWVRLAEVDPSQPVRIAHKRSEYLISITLPVSHPEIGGLHDAM